MNPYTLIEKLAGDHMLARIFTLKVLSQTLATMPDAHRLAGIATLGVGDNDEIDVYIDLVEAAALRAFHEELSAERVEFRPIYVDGRPAALVGHLDGTDRVRIFVDGRNTLRVAVSNV